MIREQLREKEDMGSGIVRYYQSHEGDHKLAYREWKGEDPSDEIFLYIHGIESHSSWFSATADLLARSGHTVLAPDRRGSGRSEGTRGHVRSYHDILGDIRVLHEKIKEKRPDSRVYLIGMSLGGSIGINYVMKYADVTGLILLSPAIATKVDLPLMTKAQVLVSSIVSPKKKFSIPIRSHMFTRNEEFISYIRNDPLRLRKVTARFYLELLRLKFNQLRKPHLITTPVLTLMAGQDLIIDNEAVIRWMKRLRVPSEYHIFEDAYHSLQLEKMDVERPLIDRILNWMQNSHGV